MQRAGLLKWFHAYRNECALFILVLAAAIPLCSWTWSRTAVQQLAKTENEVVSVQTGLHQPDSISTVANPTPHQDFAASLPTAVRASEVVSHLQQFSAAAAVTFVSVEVAASEATERALGRTELRAVLKGDYAKIKLVLAQTLDRHRGIALQRLSLRRLSGANDLEASLSLLLLTRPAALSVAAEAAVVR